MELGRHHHQQRMRPLRSGSLLQPSILQLNTFTMRCPTDCFKHNTSGGP